MAYTKVNWADYPNETTPVNATNLNRMDTGISSLDAKVGATSISGIGDGTLTGAVYSLNSKETNLENKVNNVGITAAETPSDYVTVGNSATSLVSITIPAGIHIIFASAIFKPNEDGVRKMWVGKDENTYNNERGKSETQNACTDGYTVLNNTSYVNLSSPTTYYVNVYSSENVGARAAIRYLRIR